MSPSLTALRSSLPFGSLTTLPTPSLTLLSSLMGLELEQLDTETDTVRICHELGMIESPYWSSCISSPLPIYSIGRLSRVPLLSFSFSLWNEKLMHAFRLMLCDRAP